MVATYAVMIWLARFDRSTSLPLDWPHFKGMYVRHCLQTSIVCLGLLGACAQEIPLDQTVRPLADAGDDQLRLQLPGGRTIGLDGRGSCDPEGGGLDNYLWALRVRPDGSTAVLDNNTRVHASFVADLLGRYEIELVVSRGANDSQPDVVSVELRDDLAVDPAPTVPGQDRCGQPLD